MDRHDDRSDEDIANWSSSELPDDDLHRWFEQQESAEQDWLDVPPLARRAWQLMFQEDVEPDSPIDNLFNSISASAYQLAIMNVAHAIGVDADELQTHLSAVRDDGCPVVSGIKLPVYDDYGVVGV